MMRAKTVEGAAAMGALTVMIRVILDAIVLRAAV
jgi:hypothetical protein